MFGFGGAIVLLMTAGSARAQESPMWLRGRGRAADADRAGAALGVSGTDCAPGVAVGEEGAGAEETQERLGRGSSARVAPTAVPDAAVGEIAGPGRARNSAAESAAVGCDAGDGAREDKTRGPSAKEAAPELGPGRGDGGETAPLRRLFQPEYRLILYLATTSVCLLQLSGINTVIIFSGSLLADAGLGRRMQVLGSVGVSAVLFVGNFPATRFMDSLGRRTLMAASHLGMAACLLGVAAASFAGGGEGDPAAAYASLVLVAVYCFFFSVGVGPVPFTYVAEIMPGEIRGVGMSFATAAHWVANVVVGLTFPFMVSGIGVGGTYLLYAGVNLAGAAFACFHMVESKRKTLQRRPGQLTRRQATGKAR